MGGVLPLADPSCDGLRIIGGVTDSCFVCGGSEELSRRPVVLWRRADDGVETQLSAIASCVRCRNRMRRLCDAHGLAMTPTPESYRRYRVWDVGGAMLVLALAYAVAAAAGWVGTWSLYLAIALVLALVPVMVIARRVLDAGDQTRSDRWARSETAAEHASTEAEVRAAWSRFVEPLRDEGWSSSMEVNGEERASIDEGALLDPRTWTPHADGAPRYVVRRGGRADEVRLDVDA